MSNSTDEMLILPNAKRARISESEDEDKDRISDLPDCILLNILSFVKAKYAVRTCILSTRWKNVWKRLPTLILHSSEFYTVKNFTKFASRLLSLRDGSTALQGLDFERRRRIQPRFLKRIIKYAVSHNVQRLALSVTCDIQHFPDSIFSSQILTSLKLEDVNIRALFPKSLNLPALTSLHLDRYTFRANDDDEGVVAEPFSSLIRLNSLIIEDCKLSGAEILNISSKTLTKLTLLNILFDYKMHLSSPVLHTFAFTGNSCHTLSARNTSSIEHVNFHIPFWRGCSKSCFVLLNWLEELSNIKSLTVSLSTLQVLLSIPDLLKLKVPILGSLKSLKIKQRAELIPDGIVDFLLQNSPSAKVDIIRCSI